MEELFSRLLAFLAQSGDGIVVGVCLGAAPMYLLYLELQNKTAQARADNARLIAMNKQTVEAILEVTRAIESLKGALRKR